MSCSINLNNFGGVSECVGIIKCEINIKTSKNKCALLEVQILNYSSLCAHIWLAPAKEGTLSMCMCINIQY